MTHGPCGRASPVLGRAREQSREVAAARGAGAALTASDGSEGTASACRPPAGGAASCGHRRLWRARDPRPRQRPPRCGLRRAARRCREVTRAACAQGHPAARSWVTGPGPGLRGAGSPSVLTREALQLPSASPGRGRWRGLGGGGGVPRSTSRGGDRLRALP